MDEFKKRNDNAISSDNLLKDHACKLTKLDPWDVSIKHLLDIDYNPNANCTQTFKQRSHIDSNGHLWIDDIAKNETCYFRCLFPQGEFNITVGNWTRIDNKTDVQPECDVLDVKCELSKNVTYKFVHLHVFEKP